MMLCILPLSTVFGQQQANPCETEEARQFDFWVGEWNLTWGEDQHGTNTVTQILGGCVIQEQFNGNPSSPLIGMSVSSYNHQLEQWQQTWVDNSGGYLDFTGELRDGKMILSRQAERDGDVFLQRMVFYNIQENSLDWNWERSTDDGETWEVLWHINYQRAQ
jgi:hypothetical protein